MKAQQLEVIRGSGNVYRDLGHDDADVKQFKALLAAGIIKTLDREQLSVRSQMIRLLKLLEPGRFVEFTALFEADIDVPRLVVTFLAILELAREQLIDVAQAEPLRIGHFGDERPGRYPC